MRISDWSSDVCSSDLVRVTVDRDAVGIQFHDLVQRTAEAVHTLERQTIDQVDAGRTERRLTRRLKHLAGLLEALDPVDRLLHHRIEILDTDRDTVEAQQIGRASCRERVCQYV